MAIEFRPLNPRTPNTASWEQPLPPSSPILQPDSSLLKDIRSQLPYGRYSCASSLSAAINAVGRDLTIPNSQQIDHVHHRKRSPRIFPSNLWLLGCLPLFPMHISHLLSSFSWLPRPIHRKGFAGKPRSEFGSKLFPSLSNKTPLQFWYAWAYGTGQGGPAVAAAHQKYGMAVLGRNQGTPFYCMY